MLLPLAWYTFPKLYSARACPTYSRHSRFSRTETKVTSVAIIYLKYTDTRPACLHAGWQTILDVGLLFSYCAYQTHAVVAEHVVVWLKTNMYPLILIKWAFKSLKANIWHPNFLCTNWPNQTLSVCQSKSTEEKFHLYLHNTLVVDLKYQNQMTHLIVNGSGYIQMSLATNHCFIIPSQKLQCVPKVATGFGLTKLISNCSGK